MDPLYLCKTEPDAHDLYSQISLSLAHIVDAVKTTTAHQRRDMEKHWQRLDQSFAGLMQLDKKWDACEAEYNIRAAHLREAYEEQLWSYARQLAEEFEVWVEEQCGGVPRRRSGARLSLRVVSGQDSTVIPDSPPERYPSGGHDAWERELNNVQLGYDPNQPPPVAEAATDEGALP